MKRFLLFAYETYYPVGGWHDLVDSFDTREAAVDAAMAVPTTGTDRMEICEIIDSHTGEIVGCYCVQPDDSRAEVEIKT